MSIPEILEIVLKSSVYKVKSFCNFFILEIVIFFSKIIILLEKNNFWIIKASLNVFNEFKFNSFVNFFTSFCIKFVDLTLKWI